MEHLQSFCSLSTECYTCKTAVLYDQVPASGFSSSLGRSSSRCWAGSLCCFFWGIRGPWPVALLLLSWQPPAPQPSQTVLLPVTSQTHTRASFIPKPVLPLLSSLLRFACALVQVRVNSTPSSRLVLQTLPICLTKPREFSSVKGD